MRFADISAAHLLLDSTNPRLDDKTRDVGEPLAGLWSTLADKQLRLARDIAVEGMLDPSQRVIVTPAENKPDFYSVLEGNRRLAALRALESPSSVSAFLDAAQRKTLSKHATIYRNNRIEKVACVVFDSREEARRWIELRHAGESDGVGVVKWSATEKGRYRSRRGVPELAIQVVDYVRANSNTDAATKQLLGGRFITTLRRLLNDPAARDTFGISRDEQGNMTFHYPAEEVLRTLERVVFDFASGSEDVGSVYTKAKRKGYIASIPETTLPDPAQKLAAPVLPGASPPSRTTARPSGVPPGPRVTGAPGKRTKVVPSNVRLRIPSGRLAKIFKELRELPADEFQNAAAVLLRVFLELSIDEFILKNALASGQDWEKMGLTGKINMVIGHFAQSGILTRRELQPIRHAVQNDKHMLGASLSRLHAYIHNPSFAPTKAGLTHAWDELQVLFEAIWK